MTSRRCSRHVAFAALFLLPCFRLEAQVPAPVTAAAAVSSPSSFKLEIDPDNLCNFAVLDDKGIQSLTSKLIGWAPGYRWVTLPPPPNTGTPEHMILSTPFTVDDVGGGTIHVTVETSKADDAAVYKYTLTSTKDVALTSLVAEIAAPETLTSGSLTFTSMDVPQDLPFPITNGDTFPGVSKIVFHLAKGDVVAAINPPTPISLEATGVRVLFAADLFKAGTTTTTVRYSFAASSPAPAAVVK